MSFPCCSSCCCCSFSSSYAGVPSAVSSAASVLRLLLLLLITLNCFFLLQVQQLLPEVNVPLVLTRDPTVACAILRVQSIDSLAARVHRLPGYVLVCEVPGELQCEDVQREGEWWMEVYVVEQQQRVVGQDGEAGLQLQQDSIMHSSCVVRESSESMGRTVTSIKIAENEASRIQLGRQGHGNMEGGSGQTGSTMAKGSGRGERRVLALLPCNRNEHGGGADLTGIELPSPDARDVGLVRVAAILNN